MGMSYSAVMVNKPEAWEVGKDYYGLTDVFPACAYQKNALGCADDAVSVEDVKHLVGSRHYVSGDVFRVTDYYKTADEMVARVLELKGNSPFFQGGDSTDLQNLRGMFEWAGDEPIQFISDFDELEERDAADEYQLCAKPRKYRHVNEWNGKAGRKVGY